ncbi:MAG: hypothetical protein AAFV43_16330 [Planctomycetota bacterium]
MPSTTAAAPTNAPAWRRATEAVPRGVWGVADQGIVSLANFATPVLVGRYGGREELGYYTLGLSVYLFVYALARSVVWTPYTKHSPELTGAELAGFTGSCTAHLGVFSVASTAVVGLTAAAAGLAGNTAIAWTLLAAVPMMAAMLLREHVRRLCMAQMDFVGVLAFDSVVSLAQVSLIVSLAVSRRIDAASAFLAIALTVVLPAAWIAMNRRDFAFAPSRFRGDWLRNWSVAKWLAAASSMVTLGNQGYRWVLPALAGMAELGRLGAAQVMVQLTNPIVIGLSNYLGPMTARTLADEGSAALYEKTKRISVAMAGAILMFLGVVALIGVPLVRLLLDDAAEGVTRLLVVTLAAGALSEALLMPIQAATVNRGRADLLFRTAITRLVINLTLGFGLVSAYGAEAIGVGMVLGSVVALTWQWIAFAVEVDRD